MFECDRGFTKLNNDLDAREGKVNVNVHSLLYFFFVVFTSKRLLVCLRHYMNLASAFLLQEFSTGGGVLSDYSKRNHWSLAVESKNLTVLKERRYCKVDLIPACTWLCLIHS